MSKLLILTISHNREQTNRARELEQELTGTLGVTTEIVGLFRGKMPHGQALSRRALKKQITAALPDLIEALLRLRPSVVYCMHYEAAIAACEARRRSGLDIPVCVSLRGRALLAPETKVRVLPEDPSELIALISAQTPDPPSLAGQVSDRKTVRRISRALKFAAKQAKLIRNYPFLTEEHLEWEL